MFPSLPAKPPGDAHRQLLVKIKPSQRPANPSSIWVFSVLIPCNPAYAHSNQPTDQVPSGSIHRRLTTDAATDMLVRTRLVLLHIAVSRQRGCLHLSTRLPCQPLSSAASANLTSQHERRSHAQQCCASHSNNSRRAFYAAIYVTKVLVDSQHASRNCKHRPAVHPWPNATVI